MLSNEHFYIILGCIAFVGVILFILTGFIRVKKGFVAVIEKMGLYTGTYQSGFHYFPPLTSRRVGLYKLGEVKRLVEVDRFKSFFLTYEIMNFKDFHYKGHDLDSLVKLAYKENPLDLESSLKRTCPLLSVRFIKIEVNKK
ncbi:MAG: hypothetical protein WCZ47_04705 [Bacilli bacterium]